MEKEIVLKGGSKAMHDLALSRTQKVCKEHGRYAIVVVVSSLFEVQTTSWIRIVNGVEKYVREAVPIQEERASVKPAAKARRILKPSSTSNWNFVPMGQRKWIDIEVKRSKDPCCFQMSKFMTQLLRHKEVGREEDAGVRYSRIVDEWKFYQMNQDIGQTI